jgi:hypothetical protein
VALFRKRKGTDADSNDVGPDDWSTQPAVKDKDLVVINQLAEHGADLTEPREVIFWLYAPNQEVASALASEASADVFDIEIREPLAQDPDLWAVVCSARAIIDPIFVGGAVEFFEELAERHGAEYDGWEAEV